MAEFGGLGGITDGAMNREPWKPTLEDVIRLRLYIRNRWLYDCPVCGHALHDGACMRKVWQQPKGITTNG